MRQGKQHLKRRESGGLGIFCDSFSHDRIPSLTESHTLFPHPFSLARSCAQLLLHPEPHFHCYRPPSIHCYISPPIHCLSSAYPRRHCIYLRSCLCHKTQRAYSRGCFLQAGAGPTPCESGGRAQTGPLGWMGKAGFGESDLHGRDGVGEAGAGGWRARVG